MQPGIRIKRTNREPVFYYHDRDARPRGGPFSVLRSLFHGRRRRLDCHSLLLLLLIGSILFYTGRRLLAAWKHAQKWKDPPPLYGQYHAAELALPQHDRATALQGQKYLWVNNHVSGEWFVALGG